MATTNTAGGGSDMASLVASVAGEATKILQEEFQHLRSQLQDELSKGSSAAINLGSGAALGALSGILLAQAVVHAVHRATGAPLWLSYAVVGGLLGLGGTGLLAAGADQAADLRLMPEKAGQALKESFSGAPGRG